MPDTTFDASDLRLAALTVYPLKSAAGIAVEAWPVDDFGLRHDRRWALVDESGVCLTQREHPRMALLRPALEGDRLRLEAPGLPTLDVPPTDALSPATEVVVWEDRVEGRLVAPEADTWLREAIGVDCRLVHMPATARRAVVRGGIESRVSFADAYPFLLIGEASLDDLNARLALPVPMNRFRPNLVVRGAAPFAEDGWRRLRVGEIDVTLAKPCARCVLTTVDQATGVKDGREPLRTLAGYRTVAGKVLFGQNAIHHGTGRLALGDAAAVLDRA